MTVGEYKAKFQELMKYWPHYQHGDGEEDSCAQFEHGLRPDIRATVSVFQLIDLPTLVSKSRIFEANSRGKTVDTRGAGPVRQDRRPPSFSRGPYSGLNSSQSRGSSSQERSSGSGLGSSSFRGPLKCFSNCGKLGHVANECWAAKRSGSASASQRSESRESIGPSTGQKLSFPSRVFAMIRGKCIIKGRLLNVLFDSGAMDSSISMDCVKNLNLYVTELPCNVVVTTPMGKPTVTSWVCLGCAIMVHSREFEVDLICLPLSQLDVILEMDWLAVNHVLLDCRKKTLIFGATMTEVPKLMSQGAWENIVNAKAFMVMFSMETKSVVEPEYILMVRDFLEIFPEDVSELPPEKEIESVIASFREQVQFLWRLTGCHQWSWQRSRSK
ncbi:uncharacterized protein LOC113874648 [Abrus precatorius]|uniref:Uncharacterized protein LOC113874648 n=1 Tax=Abrus precatorius TaxID=3816 RepID=A0A8B8MN51_ABRPR|nr:uncharacterized protein LOC113874648 [Abrus precatorius]